MDDDPAKAFRTLLSALADIYRAEGRPGGDAVAEAYERAAREAPPPAPAVPYRLDAVIRAALAGADHPAAVAAREAHSCLRWTATGILDDQIPSSVSDIFAVVSLIGPGAMVETDGVRAGLFMQVAGAWYPPHAHNAEETYVMLAGEGEWSLDDAPPVRHGPGSYIHHPSNGAHATRTGLKALVAAWRWSGDIGLESYRLVEDTLR